MSGAYSLKQTLAPTLALFTSAGTLVCCALPALFVSLGMGATLAGLVTAVPGLIWLSKYKIVVFAISGTLIVIAGLLQYNARNLPCPADPQKAKACARLRIISWWIWGIAAVSYTTGFFFAFIAPKILF